MMPTDVPRPRRAPPPPPRPQRKASPGAAAPGQQVDRRYLLKREIARGGTAVVYEAEHAITKRTVALKVLYGAHATRSETRTRLLAEAQALESARGPGVVELLDAGICETLGPYLAMEMLEGRTVRGIITSRGQLPLPQVVGLGYQLCRALARAHENQIVHRDIKPCNVFIARSGRSESVKVFDFGIAHTGPVLDEQDSQNSKLTKQDEILGTPEYMSPERLLTQGFDHRADVYAIAVTLYECLTGAVPFEGNFACVLLKISTEPLRPPSVARPDLPRAFVEVLMRALAKDPNVRPATVSAFAQALVEGSGVSPGPTNLLGLTAPTATPSLPDVAPLPDTAPPPEARRRYARAPYVTPTRILLPNGSHVDGNSEDISEGGLLVSTPQACTNGDSVEVRFALPLVGRIVRVQATTRWVRTARQTGATGLQFVSLPPDARRDIAEYVRAMGGTS